MKHQYHKCDKNDCFICEGGLLYCEVCHLGEVELESDECAGVVFTCKKCDKKVLPESFDKEIGICEDCFYEEQKEVNNSSPQMIRVTSDMATDAGDKRLEGQLIRW